MTHNDAPPRLEGLDIARALAILVMVPVNYVYVIAPDDPTPEWIWDGVNAVTGRAAALFIILAGVGVSMLARRIGPPACRAVLLRRSVALALIGFAFSFFWPPDILEFYALYLASAALLLRAKTLTLVATTAIVFVVGIALHLVLNYETGWDYETFDYENMWAPLSAARRLFFNGYHPVFPWLGFVTLGMLIGRLRLDRPSVRVTLLLTSLLLTIALETLSLTLQPTDATSEWADLYSITFSRVAMPATPLFVLASSATAAAVIALTLSLTPVIPRRLRGVLVATGQLALTLYIAHGMLGALIEVNQLTFGLDPLTAAIGWTLAFNAAALLFASLWRRRFSRGPAETLLRSLAPSKRVSHAKTEREVRSP